MAKLKSSQNVGRELMQALRILVSAEERGPQARALLQNSGHFLCAVREPGEHLPAVLRGQMPAHRVPHLLRAAAWDEPERVLPLLSPHPHRPALFGGGRRLPGLEGQLPEL